MKQIAFLSIFILFFQMSWAQKTQDFDVALTKALQKQIVFPDCNKCDYSGLALIRISNIKDSLIVTSLYASEDHFNQSRDSAFVRRFNKNYKNKFPKNCDVIIPLYFNYFLEGENLKPVNIASKKDYDLRLAKIKKTHILKPVVIRGYETVR